MPILEILDDFLFFGRYVVEPEEGFVKEEGDLGEGSSIKLASAREGPE